MSRLYPLLCSAVLTTFASSCRSAPSDTEEIGERQEPAEPQPFELMTVERCGPGFDGQISVPAGAIIQEATAQTKACPGDECGGRALGMISLLFYRAPTCAEVREKLRAKPVVDAWGAQAQVMCNGQLVQALSAGRDGQIGTCDDLSQFISFYGPRHRH